MNRRPKHSRRITVDSQTWLWRCSRGGTVTLWAPSGTKTHLRPPRTSGVSEDTFERGQHKRTGDGTITPRNVAGAIRKLQRELSVDRRRMSRRLNVRTAKERNR